MKGKSMLISVGITVALVAMATGEIYFMEATFTTSLNRGRGHQRLV